MGKVISTREEKIFREEYKKWLVDLCDQLIDYRENMIIVMRDTNLKTFSEDEDFREMAKGAILHKIQIYYEQETAIDNVNEIINLPGVDDF